MRSLIAAKLILPADFVPAWDRALPAVQRHLAAHPEHVDDRRAMWAHYEATLLDLRPAVATPRTASWGAQPFGDEEVTTIRYFDARANTFHRSTLDERRLLLPYLTRFDAESWAASQAVVIWRSLCLLGSVIQVRHARTTD